MDGDEAKSSSTNGKQERLEVVDDDGESESTISETEGQINHEFNGGIKCENCPAYQANAHKAWTILADYGKAQRQIKELETRCDQLERIGQEARDYNDTLRINDEALNETIKARDMEIRNWQEKYADIENQYAKVLKAGMEAKKSTDEFNALRKKFEEVEQECSDFKKKLKEALASKDELQRKFKAACLMLSKSKKSPGQSHHFNLDTVFESRFLMEMKKMPLLLDDIDLIFGPPPIPEIAPQIEIFEENEVSIQELQEMEVEEQTIPEPTKEPPTIQKPQTEENVASASIPTQIDEEEPEEEAPNLQIDEEEEKEEDEPTIHEEKVASTSPNELQLEEEPTIPNSQIESQPEKEAPNLQIDEEPEEEAPNLQIDEESEEAEDEPTIQRAQNEEKVTTSTPIPNRQTSPEDEDEEPMIIIERFETEEEQEEVPTTIKNRQIDNSPEPMNEDEPTTSTSNVVQKRTTNIQSSPEPEDEEEGPTIQQNRRIEEKAAEAASSIPKLQIDPSQIDWKRPKDLAINDIRKKYRIDKDEATLVYCEALREQRKQWFGGKRKRISSDEDGQDSDGDYGLGGSKKIRSEPAAMPWVPKNHLLPLNARPSILTFDEHKRYVAIISNELKADATYRHGENKLELKSLDKKLEEERKYYVETALKKAKNIKDAFGCPYWTVNLFKDLQRMKVQLYIGDRAFQGVVHSIPWPTTNRTTTRALNLRIVNVLSQGSAKIASIPDIKKKYEMRVDKLSKAMKWQYNNKEPIIEDQQIQDFGLANNVPLLMDASTFRHLLCSAWSHRLQSYACRLTVMRRVHSAQMKSIIIISPPIIASQLYKTTVAQPFVKWALKTNILREKQQPKTSTSTSSPPKKARKDENDGDGDYLSLLEEMGLGFIGASNKSDQCGKGKRYAIVSLGDLKKEEAMADDEQKYRVLVRTACRLLEKNTPEEKHISTTAHAEFLPEVGAEKLTDEEMLWNVVTGMLHGSEEHLNFRINVSRVAAEKPNVLQIDRRQSTNLQKIPNEIRQLLSARIQRFCALLDAVSELAVGEYILMPDSKNGALQIVKEKTDFNMEDDEMDGACYDSDWFKDLLNKKGRPVPSNEIERYWNGIDPHYPLQYQIVRTQIPGALRPQTKKK